jgi:hypothetical protein
MQDLNQMMQHNHAMIMQFNMQTWSHSYHREQRQNPSEEAGENIKLHKVHMHLQTVLDEIMCM